MDELKILAFNGQLGYGFPIESFNKGLMKGPDLIGADAGSMDQGPYYLGEGKAHTDRAGIKRDLSIVLPAAIERGIPLIIGTAGASGADIHLTWTREILLEVAKEKGLHFKLALIHAEIPKSYVIEKYREGKITSIYEGQTDLNFNDIEYTSRIVGQMGMDPFIKALDYEPDVILAGRSCDTAIFASLPVKHGFDPALTIHMAKIIECGAYCAVNGSGSDSIFATIRKDDFILEPLNSNSYCTPESVAAHTLYEQAHPSIFIEPDGIIDCSNSEFYQLEDGKVRVTGTEIREHEGAASIKLEGASLQGYRTISILGIRDQNFINCLSESFDGIKELIANNYREQFKAADYSINFRVYGKNAVLGELEKVKVNSHEVGIVIDVVASKQDIANTICSYARTLVLHYPYKNRKTTGGNAAVLFSPHDIPVGPVYKFTLYHLMETENLKEDSYKLFPIELMEV